MRSSGFDYEKASEMLDIYTNGFTIARKGSISSGLYYIDAHFNRSKLSKADRITSACIVSAWNISLSLERTQEMMRGIHRDLDVYEKAKINKLNTEKKCAN
jgi:hypothetical protein